VEESRLVPKEILEGVIKPFLEVRTPPYRLKSEYANDPRLDEEGKINFISSSWFRSEYWYSEYVRNIINRILKGDKTVGFLAFDYSVCLFHKIKTPQMLKNEMDAMDEASLTWNIGICPRGFQGRHTSK
jgi:hypothetical protein